MISGNPDIGKVLSIIDGLYRAAVDGTYWHDFLRSLADAFSSNGAQIVRVQPRDSRLNFSALYGYDDRLTRIYRTDDLRAATALFEEHFAQLMPTDPRMRFLEQYPGRPLSCRLELAEADMHGSEIYKQMLSHADVEYSLVVSLAEDDGSLIVLGVFRGRDATYFTHDDVATFSELIPHLKQAVSVSEHLSQVRFEADAAFGALDSLGVGVFILEPSGRLIHGNAAGHEIARERDGIFLEDGVMHFSRSDDAAAFKAHLLACMRETDGAVAGMYIGRPSGRDAIQLTIDRLRDRTGAYRQAAVVLFSQPEAVRESRADLLRRLFGLTAAEARLCELMAQGNSLLQAAEVSDIAVPTARTHLKRIFAKVGVNRQSQLVQSITSSSAWMVHERERKTIYGPS